MLRPPFYTYLAGRSREAVLRELPYGFKIPSDVGQVRPFYEALDFKSAINYYPTASHWSERSVAILLPETGTAVGLKAGIVCQQVLSHHLEVLVRRGLYYSQLTPAAAGTFIARR